MTKEDCLSRKAVLDTLDTADKFLDEDRTVENYKALLKECYEVLTPVTPPSEDCVSRQALISAFPISDTYTLDDIIATIKFQPPVTPARKKGKWIFAYRNKGKDNVEKCSCCDSHWREAIIYRTDTQEYLRTRLLYCPNCGAEMEVDK